MIDASTPLAAGSFRSGAAGGSSSSAADAGSTAATDFETFLTLLTAQMRNQDPLQPMDSTEFVSQLASFSAVEQQIESNKRLDALIDAVAGGSGAGLAQWIGKEVQVAAAARFDDRPLSLAVAPPEGAAAASLVVRDGAGSVVGRLPVDPTADRVTWDGSLGDSKAPPGLYSFEVDYADGEGVFATREVQTFAKVAEIRFSSGAADLVLEGGVQVSPEDVASVRKPSTTD